MRYSLANYIVSLEPNDNTIKDIFGTITFGGEGSYMNTITISREQSLFSTKAYSTGAWYHDKDLKKNGTISLSINQLSEQISSLIKLLETYYTGDYEGFTLTVTNNNGDKVATCIDCYVQGVPSQTFGETAGTQTWTITSGKITFGE